jgi:hypothetical protein
MPPGLESGTHAAAVREHRPSRHFPDPQHSLAHEAARHELHAPLGRPNRHSSRSPMLRKTRRPSRRQLPRRDRSRS